MTATPPPAVPTTRRRLLWVIAAIVVVGLASAVVAATHREGSSTVAGQHPLSSASAGASESASSAPSSSAGPPSTSAPLASAAPAPAAPTPLASSAQIAPQLTAALSSFEAVNGVATTPGEVAGPAIRFVVTITNSTPATVNLASTVVTLNYGKDSTPGIPLSKPGSVSLPPTVAAGQTAKGTYVFTVPPAERSDVRVQVDYALGVAPLIFEGSIPR